MDDIAIVGMGCLFPGASSPKQYWDNLINQRDSATPLSIEETGVDPGYYYDPVKGQPDKICYNNNGHVRGFEFDSSGYALPQKELDSLDNLFKWTLYAADQALIDSGYRSKPLDKTRCGLIAGNIGMPTHSGKKLCSSFYHQLLEPYIQQLTGEPSFKFGQYWGDTSKLSDYNLLTASYNAIIAAQALGLTGPSYTIDAACSSAIYVMKIASYYLSSGKADLMIAGSVCHADHIYIDHGFNVLQAFPDKGESIPFDSESEGLKAGEGSGFVVLKRYADAVRDQDKIYGVIENIGLSNDAGAKHILVPDFDGQVSCLEKAYSHHSRDIEYLECHATGTPVGDQVELNSIEHFFYENGSTPLIGANKGNVGHMLTASGMASMLKVLLSMQHETMPGTIKVDHLVETKNKKISIDHVVRENKPWPIKDSPRRAGINAFGFGGVNGHMVIRDYQSGQAAKPASTKLAQTHDKKDAIAITGISVALADTYETDKFSDTIKSCGQKFTSLPETRWSGIDTRPDICQQFGIDEVPNGAYIEKFEFDCKRFKLPPKMAGIHLLSHMSLMQIAARAFYDAGYEVDGKKKNIAVIIAGDIDFTCYRYQARNEISWQIDETLKRCNINLSDEQVTQLESIVKDSLFPEPYAEGITGGIGNVVASRVSAILKLNGPAFTLCSHENSVFKAMELAEFMLSLNEVEAVIVGSGSFGGSAENVLWGNKQHSVNSGNVSLGYEQDNNGWNVGEGGGVIVLKRQQDAKRDQDKTYAVIRSMEILQDNQECNLDFVPSATAVAKVAEQSLKNAGIQANDVGYLEVNGSGNLKEDQAEINGLTQVYSDSSHPCMIGSVKANYGHLSAAAGIASIIKAAMCLYHRYLPGTPHWNKAKAFDNWEKGSLYVSPQSQDWQAASDGKKRIAAINSIGIDRSYTHLLLQEGDEEDREGKNTLTIKEEDLRNNALITTLYIGREKTIPQMILNESTQKFFPQPIKSPVPVDLVEETQDIASHNDNIVAFNRPERAIDIEASLMGGELSEQYTSPLKALYVNQYIRNASTHLSYLKMEEQFYKRMGSYLEQSVQEPAASYGAQAGHSHVDILPPISDHAQLFPDDTQPNELPAPVAPVLPPVIERKDVLLNEDQLVELTDGSVAKVFGPEYAEADTYPIRTRMPSPPYMFASRITKLTAKQGLLEPCMVEWEYDLPEDAWYVTHGLVPAFVSLESSHAMIVAFTYIGCDQLFKGELRYRAVDSQTTVYSDMPKAGEVLRGTVDIKSFSKLGKNIVINYEYNCYVGDRRAFKLTATSGFFPLSDIEKSKGVNPKAIFSKATKSLNRPKFPLSCSKTQFNEADIEAIQNGDLETCFGKGYAQTVVPGLYAPKAKMLDRISELDPNGGAWGLGCVIGERDIIPSHWAFQAHFKNDPVMPGTLIVEGCEQLLKFYLYYMGLQSQKNLRPTLIQNHQYSAKFRGEVKCERETLKYRLTCKKMDFEYQENAQDLKEVTLIFVAEIIYRDNVIGICDNLGARFVSE